jgi:hypothetical protein
VWRCRRFIRCRQSDFLRCLHGYVRPACRSEQQSMWLPLVLSEHRVPHPLRESL